MEHNVNDNPHDHLKIINVISLAPEEPQPPVIDVLIDPPQVDTTLKIFLEITCEKLKMH